MKNSVDFESVLSLIDSTISPTYLNPTQEIVLREVWNGKTYSRMADDYNYDPEYIKTVGCNLWQTLSFAFNEQINKSNFVPFMRQKIRSLIVEPTDKLTDYQPKLLSTNLIEPQFYHWTTAPDTKYFLGREEEIRLLHSWRQDFDCRCIVVSGMVGCGKTSLVTKFAKNVKNQFDCVIWFSLDNPPSITTLINNYLNIISQHSNHQIDSESIDLSLLLSQLIDYLKQKKILLVLDGLQSVFEANRTSIYYKKELEDYGQFFRSLISTNHQSLLICTSRLKPKLLEYYANNQIKILNLQGFTKQTTRKFIDLEISSTLDKQKLLDLSESLQNNPQLLKIAYDNLDIFNGDNIQQIVQELSLLEEITSLLQQELSCLSNLEQEIICWLAISDSSVSSEELSNYLEQSQPKIKFLHSINSLVERSLITQSDATYSLMPIMKSYLRRKLVKQALQTENYN